MKTLTVLTALALFGMSTAFASSATTTATQASTATAAVHKSTKECNKEAQANKIPAKEHDAYMKKCKQGM